MFALHAVRPCTIGTITSQSILLQLMLRLTVCMCLTGQGGNDLLGNRKQTGHQELVRGNLALVSNYVSHILYRLMLCWSLMTLTWRQGLYMSCWALMPLTWCHNMYMPRRVLEYKPPRQMLWRAEP